jgi:glyoxylase-like metal-dependent hydrolase (beta-lactamase superfamily II)
MKSLHRPDLFLWSTFDRERNVDFNTTVWHRPGGSIVVDPLPVSDHDLAHLTSLGPVAWIVVTNSDHRRAAAELVEATGAKLAGPRGEKDTLGLACDRWLEDGDELVPGLRVFALEGSKTPGELALLLDGTVLVTGDLVRAHRAGTLMLLPDAKLTDEAAARASVARLAALPVRAVIVGDGWPLFEGGSERLRQLVT